MQIIRKLLFLLSTEERKKALLLLIMIFFTSLLDMIGVASILPFMTVLTNPDLVETNFVLNILFKFSIIFGIQNNQQFILFLGSLSFLILIISLGFKAFTIYIQVRFVQLREFSISKRLIEGYLNQPYSWFLNRNSADLGKTILSEVQQVIGNGIRPLIELIAKGMLTIAILILLLIVDTKLTLTVGFFLVGLYSIIFYIVRKYLSSIGEKRLKNNKLRFMAVSEAFGAVKEIKIGDLEKYFIKRFSISAQIFAETQAASRAINQLPRFFLEAIAFGGILLILLFITAQTGTFNNALPIVSLYIFAGYRLMPALQQIYSSLTQLTFVGPSLDKLHEDLRSFKKIILNDKKKFLSFNNDIKLRNISYSYPNVSQTAIKDLNLSIPKKNTIGIIGPTGCGKTTTVDILLGLLEPQNGTVEIDGKILTKESLKSWQQSIGYVPQNIYLSDDTIAANIAFGLKSELINYNEVEKASKTAKLHDFIIEELPNKYQTIIGERGIRLSGGQRQRIGIARALYKNPKVLILDEATSALDNETEQAVMDAVNNLSKNITIILIAHRLNTVKNCDKIFKLDKGELISENKF